MRAKWRARKSGRCSAPQKVLDRGDIVRDGRSIRLTSNKPRTGRATVVQVSFRTTANLWPSGGQRPTMVGDWLHGGTPKVQRKCRRFRLKSGRKAGSSQRDRAITRNVEP